MRCPDCSKFVSMDNADPEVNSVEVVYNGDKTATVTADIRLIRACADCSTELKSLDVQVEETVDLTEMTKDGDGENKVDGDALHTALDSLDAELEVEGEDCEVEETGGSRFAKNMIQFSLAVVVSVELNGATYKVPVSLNDEAAAGDFEECC